MKKIILVLLVLVIVGGSAFAIDLLAYPPPIGGGNILLDAGLGLALGYGDGKMKIPPLFVQGDYCLPIQLPISVGASFSFFRFGRTYTNVKATWTFVSFMARGNWHWNIPVDWLDLYTGLSLGYLYFGYKTEPDVGSRGEPDYGGFDWAGQVGARFYFTDFVGAMVEIGYPYLKAGVTFKF